MPITSLDGTTAIVTGIGRGFGQAVTHQLVRAGAHVVGIARSEAGVSALRREYANKFDAEFADAADPCLPARLFASYSPQIVVLNAGATPRPVPSTRKRGRPSAPTGTSTSARPSTSPRRVS